MWKTVGSADGVEAHDRLLLDHQSDWLVREIRLYLRRVFKRLDVTSRSLFALIEPGSCFAGTLLELALACDRSYMLDGTREGDDRPAAAVRLTALNLGAYPMVNGLGRLASRFLDEPARADDLKGRLGQDLDAAAALEAGLVTFAPDDIDWEDEVRIAHGGAGGVLSRRPHRHGGVAPVRRPRDPREQDLRAPLRLAELDFPASERGGSGRGPQGVRDGDRAEFDRRRV